MIKHKPLKATVNKFYQYMQHIFVIPEIFDQVIKQMNNTEYMLCIGYSSRTGFKHVLRFKPHFELSINLQKL